MPLIASVALTSLVMLLVTAGIALIFFSSLAIAFFKKPTQSPRGSDPWVQKFLELGKTSYVVVSKELWEFCYGTIRIGILKGREGYLPYSFVEHLLQRHYDDLLQIVHDWELYEQILTPEGDRQAAKTKKRVRKELEDKLLAIVDKELERRKAQKFEADRLAKEHKLAAERDAKAAAVAARREAKLVNYGILRALGRGD